MSGCLKHIQLLFFILAIPVLFTACDKRTTVKEELFYEYFPLNVGSWVVYDVDSIFYDDFTGHVDTFKYQVKEVVESEFTDNSGNKAFRLERFIRQDEDDDWKIKNVWTSRRLPSRAEKVEENNRFIKLAFPPRLNRTWDGNAYNSKQEKTYRITGVHETKSINDISFDSVVTVLQSDVSTLISEEYQVEIFAKNVGLVYKEYVDLTKEIDGSIVSGFDYSYTVVDHSKIVVDSLKTLYSW